MTTRRYRIVTEEGPYEYWTGDLHEIQNSYSLLTCESGSIVPLNSVRRFVPAADEPVQHYRRLADGVLTDESGQPRHAAPVRKDAGE